MLSFKQRNSGSAAARALPKDWQPDSRFIKYEYAPFRPPSTPLPQEPTRGLRATSEALKRISGSEERDFEIAMKRRDEPAAGSLAEMRKKYGL
jgi:hypothetical protein